MAPGGVSWYCSQPTRSLSNTCGCARATTRSTLSDGATAQPRSGVPAPRWSEVYSASASRVSSVSSEMRTPTMRPSRSLNLCTTSGMTRALPFARTLYSMWTVA
jgi:hypothetical protein